MKLKNSFVKKFQTGGEMPTEQAGMPPQQGPEPAPAPEAPSCYWYHDSRAWQRYAADPGWASAPP